MTENEAIAKFKRTSVLWESATNTEMVEAVKMAIQALEEIQAYRAIGTVQGFEDAIQSSLDNYNLMKEYKAKVQEFEAIGTVEEFKALKEKSVGKVIETIENGKMKRVFSCCGRDCTQMTSWMAIPKFCPYCGTKIEI